MVGVSATGRDGTERDGECQVCHASETFACDAVYCGARLCVNPTLCAQVEASEAIMYTGTIAAAAVAAVGLLSAANPSRRPLLHATYATRFIGANNCGRLYSKEGYSRVTRESR